MITAVKPVARQSLPSPTKIGAGFKFDFPPPSENNKRKIKATFHKFGTGSKFRVHRVKNTIRDGGSTALYTVYTIYTIQTASPGIKSSMHAFIYC